MDKPSYRLYFIDVIRAFAICMMLQGHFIDGLLDYQYRDTSSIFFNIWLYFRGITAPVFFTVSGFIFTFLLLKEEAKNINNPFNIRVMKGIRRGITLVIVGYILRIHPWGLLFLGKLYPNAFLVDVLHCIGLSILFLISIYLFSFNKRQWVFPFILISFTMLLFLFSPLYRAISFNHLPVWAANYFTKSNGSVFTIFPWFGYASFGAFISYFFYKYQSSDKLYPISLTLGLVLGTFLSFFTGYFFSSLYHVLGCEVFQKLTFNDNVFKRLGDVILVFTLFMSLRNILTHKTLIHIGQNTLSIYIIHYIILYGSFTGFGLYGFYHHKLTPLYAILGAIIFVISTLILSFLYNKYINNIKSLVKNICSRIHRFI